MSDATLVTALPIGEFGTDSSRGEFGAIIQLFTNLGADVRVADPVPDADEARRSVEGDQDRLPDLLLLVPLRGLSAEASESAALASPSPCLIWPIRGGFALPSSTLAVGALRERGRPVELFFTPPDHPSAIEKSRSILNAARAHSRIRRSRIGVIGGLFPNLIAAHYDPETVTARTGTTLLPLSYDSIRAGMADSATRPDDTREVLHALTDTYAFGQADQDAAAPGLHLHLALKRLAQEHQLDGFAAECWTGLPKHLGLNPCLGFAEDAYTLACEGDVMLCISLLIVRYLTGHQAYVGDLYDLDLDGVMTLIHCGAPASLSRDPRDVVLRRSEAAAARGYESITCRPRIATGAVTVFRFYGRGCDKMHLTTGELFRSDPSSTLTVNLRLSGSRDDFIEVCAGNHYVVVPGDIRPELCLLAKWAGITILET
jgi:L-fucose isomerase-like protein